MTNSVDPAQTAPVGAVWSGSTLFASILKFVSNVRHLFAADDFSGRIFSDAFSWRCVCNSVWYQGRYYGEDLKLHNSRKFLKFTSAGFINISYITYFPLLNFKRIVKTCCQLIFVGIGKVYLDPTAQIVLKVKPTHITGARNRQILTLLSSPSNPLAQI